jgi:hypothetical protein
MKNYYKIAKILPGEPISATGNYPIQEMTFAAPPFNSKKEAKKWLKGNAIDKNEYMITRFYSLVVPENLQPIKRNKK